MIADKQPEGEVTLARTLGVFEATMIGLGAMIGAGIFVLTGIAAGEAGPAAIIAFALNGVVTMFTALSYAELASAIPEAGGGYAFVRRAMPGWIGYLAGWMLWFAYIVACSLYALGFSGYFLEFVAKYFPAGHELIIGFLGQGWSQGVITLCISLFFIALNVIGTDVTGKAENVITSTKVVILAIFVAFGLAAILGAPERTLGSFSPLFPKGLGGVIVAMGLTFIAFEGYDLIATVSEEVAEPTKNIPRAIFASLGIAVLIYLFVVFVSLAAIDSGDMPSWQFLGQFQETAVVKAAENFMPWFGVALIVAGGLFSTMSALNATILAASRIAFSMGRDRMLPALFGTIHPQRRTPYVAVVASGAILVFLAFFVPVVTVGSAASLLFLLSFALVNLSVILLRRQEPNLRRGYSIPFYPWPPLLGLISCLTLGFYQYTFQPLAWYISLLWIGVGLLIYIWGASRLAVAEEGLEEPFKIIHEEIIAIRGYSVLFPLDRKTRIESLIPLVAAIAADNEGEILALHIVRVPSQLSVSTGRLFLKEGKPLLERAIKGAKALEVPVHSMIRIGRDVVRAISRTGREQKADLIVLDWRGYTRSENRLFGSVIDALVSNPPCDVAVVSLKNLGEIKRILVPTAGGPNVSLAARLAVALAKKYQAHITILNVMSEEPSPERISWSEIAIAQIMAGLPYEYEAKIVRSDSVLEGILAEAENHDLVLVGATQAGPFEHLLFGSIPERLATRCPKTVIMVKRHEGLVISSLRRAWMALWGNHYDKTAK